MNSTNILNSCSQTLSRRLRVNGVYKQLASFLFVGESSESKASVAQGLSIKHFNGRMINIDSQDLYNNLAKEVKQLGSSVVFIKNVEQAKESSISTLITLLNDGQIADQETGEVISASKCCIILTSQSANDIAAHCLDTYEF